jgi:cell division protein FtsW (lipid II flippase)
MDAPIITVRRWRWRLSALSRHPHILTSPRLGVSRAFCPARCPGEQAESRRPLLPSPTLHEPKSQDGCTAISTVPVASPSRSFSRSFLLGGLLIAAPACGLLGYCLHCTGPAELLISVFTPVVGLASERLSSSGLRRLLTVGVVLAFVLACAALSQPSYRGTHRWVMLSGVRLNTAPLLSVAMLLSYAVTPSSTRLVTLLAATLLLLLGRSYTMSLLTLLPPLMVLTAIRRSVWCRYALLLSLLLTTVSLLLTPNRLLRIQQYFSSTSYQARQIRATLHSVSLFRPAPTPLLHLPCWSHDLAMLHSCRTIGVLPTALLLSPLLLLPISALMSVARHQDHNADFPLRICAVFFSLAVTLHLCVNLGMLPPCGTVLPFCGRGVSGAAASAAMTTVACWAHLRSVRRTSSPHSMPYGEY